jgi:hypothetical protein
MCTASWQAHTATEDKGLVGGLHLAVRLKVLANWTLSVELWIWGGFLVNLWTEWKDQLLGSALMATARTSMWKTTWEVKGMSW